MTPRTTEDVTAQIPALLLMRAMGWDYVSPADCLALRGSNAEVTLREHMVRFLRQHRFEVRGRKHTLSTGAIEAILREIGSPRLQEGLQAANERLYDAMLFGVSVTEFIDGRSESVTVPIIDWHDPARNLLCVTEEFEVLKTDGVGTRRPDIVGFVNGLPWVVVEAKRPDGGSAGKDRIAEGISQHIRNQKNDEIPHLYAYSQLLLSIEGAEGRYGTTMTDAKFYARWREEEWTDADIVAVKSKRPPLGPDPILQQRGLEVRDQMQAKIDYPQLVTDQDRLLVCLLSPSRLTDFVRQYIFFSTKFGKIAARYQQVFGIQKIVERVQTQDRDGRRQGGVIWHTTGSGKSFTMVMLCKALLLHEKLAQCRILVVTDRLDLEKQLSRTFAASGALGSTAKAEDAKASSGRDLAKRIGFGEERILFSTMQRFTSAVKSFGAENDSADLIVLIDEGHRSQGGEGHARMRLAMPRAAFVAFTGTPLLKDEKTKSKFGAILHPYTMKRAVEDGTVTPLLYEERKPMLDVNDAAIDKWFERVAGTLTEKQQQDLKGKYAKRGQVAEAQGRIDLIAWDIATHFRDNFKALGLDLKGQLATGSRKAAILYKKALDETGIVTSAVIMSPPDTREGHEEVEGDLPMIQRWWKDNVTTDAEDYERQVIDAFGEPGTPDILIVVDKLLTGFDEPANAVLYIDKELKDHNLIQAIARVNRLHEQKKFGLLVDYRGILKNLDTALRDYAELAEKTGYDPEDIAGLYADVSTEYKQLPKLHRELHAMFASVKNKMEREEYRSLLRPDLREGTSGTYDANQKKREDFYEALSKFGLALKIALGSPTFYEDGAFSEEKVRTFKKDLKFFSELRRTAQRDAQETVDFSAYDKQIGKLLDTHIIGEDIDEAEGYVRLDTLLDGKPETWSAERLRNEAEVIRTRLKHRITEKLDIDPYAQAHFSKMLRDVINEAEAQFAHPLKQYQLFKDMEDAIDAGDSLPLPEGISPGTRRAALYGVVHIASPDISDSTKSVLAEKLEDVVTRSVSENSLNIQNIENGIRKLALPILFKRMGLDAAKTAVDEVVRITRLGHSR